ncbi:MAG: DUF4859 domain-containing protein [Bacteroidales bacterium]|nr:DUF4859 domain-containing protein [Bacteroidales bacterium]
MDHQLSLKPFSGSTNPYPSTPVLPDWERVCRAFKMQLSEIKSAIGSSVRYAAVQPNGNFNYNSTANAPGHWFNQNGYTTKWGNNSYLFSEFNTNNLNFNIGQYPNLSSNGDSYTIRQALVYTPNAGPVVSATFVFQIKIENEPTTGINAPTKSTDHQPVQQTIITDILQLDALYNTVLIYSISGHLILKAHRVQTLNLSQLPTGLYILRTDQYSQKFLKK